MSKPDSIVAPGFVPMRAFKWRRTYDVPKTTFQSWVAKGIVKTTLIGGQRFVLESLANVAEREAAKQDAADRAAVE